jgi:hypothetical protein
MLVGSGVGAIRIHITTAIIGRTVIDRVTGRAVTGITGIACTCILSRSGRYTCRMCSIASARVGSTTIDGRTTDSVA